MAHTAIIKEALRLVYDDLANDVDISMSTLRFREAKLELIEDAIGWETLQQIYWHCDSRLKFFASGAPYVSQVTP